MENFVNIHPCLTKCAVGFENPNEARFSNLVFVSSMIGERKTSYEQEKRGVGQGFSCSKGG